MDSIAQPGDDSESDFSDSDHVRPSNQTKQSRSGESSQRHTLRILVVRRHFCIKMLRTLLTKEIKVFHSLSRVGLAYMVVDILERKKSGFFVTSYFGCRELMTLQFLEK